MYYSEVDNAYVLPKKWLSYRYYGLPFPIFVEKFIGKCFIEFSITIDYLKCNYRVKNIFPKVPSMGGQSKINLNIKVLQSSHCWYSKFVSRVA